MEVKQSQVARLSAPFPWFGGKSRAAAMLWPRLGNPSNYVEPFAGSLAVMLARPHAPRCETVNDLDCYISNFWRCFSEAKKRRDIFEQVAEWADWPVNEADLHARHVWLVKQTEFRERMMTDPHYYDAKIAGWWAWGICQWIGGGWCRVLEESIGVHRKMVELSRSGNGVHRNGIWRKRPALDRGGRGVSHRRVKRQLPSLGGDGSGSGRGVHRWTVEIENGLMEWFGELAARLRRVRVCCGDFERVLGPSPTTHIGVTGVLLDPPYGKDAGRDDDIYAVDDLAVAVRAREWALANGHNPKLRIALCGYEGEHGMPADWECVAWKASGGYARANPNNRKRERIWFSPHCLKPKGELWEQMENNN
jgi:hypothetical protein